MVTGMTNQQQQQQQPPSPTQHPTQPAAPPIPPEPVKRSNDARRSNKPIMEKRRRARINNCLNELKTLILDAMKKDPARHSKLEKADILEMTVKHLQNLQRQQNAISQIADPSVMNKFKAGFSECLNEVGRFQGMEPVVRRRLMLHLSSCMNGVKSEPQQQQHQLQHHKPATPQVQVHILPSPPSSPQQEQPPVLNMQSSHITATANGYFLTNGHNTAGVSLIPTKLANGSIAFVLPPSIQQPVPPVPMLVPIPSRTASTGSATSSTSCYDRVPHEHSVSPYHAPPSPANSYDAMDCSPSISQPSRCLYSPAPLSLVMKKEYDDPKMGADDDKPWRPW